MNDLLNIAVSITSENNVYKGSSLPPPHEMFILKVREKQNLDRLHLE